MINTCVAVTPDLGLCSQLPISEVSDSAKELELHLAFCCGDLCSLPFGDPMLGNPARI